ncbi:MAG: hypothetical protein IKN59_06095 [Paludibacteraceae bacterium]|nr:hypothetical protein [Paludibacteraceae bacterium]
MQGERIKTVLRTERVKPLPDPPQKGRELGVKEWRSKGVKTIVDPSSGFVLGVKLSP